MKISRCAIAIGVTFGFALACQAGAINQPFDLGTHSLHLLCAGEGRPTVVIDVGVGESYEDWMPLVGRIAANTQVCVYDRAGYGRSEPGPMPRDTLREATELKLLLERAEIDGPYVLVGHSLGAAIAQVFADSFGAQVAGAVLVDSPPLAWIAGEGFPDLLEIFRGQVESLKTAAELAREASDPSEKARAVYFDAVASELESMLTLSMKQLVAIESFGDLPIVVIAPGRANPAFGESAEAYQTFWIEENRKLAARSEKGRFVLAEESSHHVHRDAPDVVVDAIRDVLEKARAR